MMVINDNQWKSWIRTNSNCNTCWFLVVWTYLKPSKEDSFYLDTGQEIILVTPSLATAICTHGHRQTLPVTACLGHQLCRNSRATIDASCAIQSLLVTHDGLLGMCYHGLLVGSCWLPWWLGWLPWWLGQSHDGLVNPMLVIQSLLYLLNLQW